MLKRPLDFCVALVGLMMLAVPLAVLAAAVRFNLGSPVFFRQDRPGRHGRIFRMVKFRTMTDGQGADGEPLPDEQRMTRFGAWLRRTSLDELPELVNVLKGDMSFVGPRPLLVEYLSLYSPEQARRHEVRPGITGWSQVNGRNTLDWDDRLALDVWYVDNHSLWLDFKIMLMTVGKVLSAEGVSQEGRATMDRFRGPGR